MEYQYKAKHPNSRILIFDESVPPTSFYRLKPLCDRWSLTDDAEQFDEIEFANHQDLNDLISGVGNLYSEVCNWLADSKVIAACSGKRERTTSGDTYEALSALVMAVDLALIHLEQQNSI